MKTAFVVIDGIKFPYFLVDKAIEWARQEGGKLNGLFLMSGTEVPEGYVFPSDIDLAEEITDANDTRNNSTVLFDDFMRLFESSCLAKGVSCHSELMIAPSLKEVVEKTKQATILMLSPQYGDPSLLGITGFNLQELADQSFCPVEIVNV